MAGEAQFFDVADTADRIFVETGVVEVALGALPIGVNGFPFFADEDGVNEIPIENPVFSGFHSAVIDGVAGGRDEWILGGVANGCECPTIGRRGIRPLNGCNGDRICVIFIGV